MEHMPATDRIRAMERHFDVLCSAMREEREMDAAMMEAARVLAAYLESGQWLQDYERDERGELPAELKRGVLSQDALYDLLTELDAGQSAVRCSADAERNCPAD